MGKAGQIKRDDIITKQALNWSDDYVKNVEKAILINKKFAKSCIKLQKIALKNKIDKPK